MSAELGPRDSSDEIAGTWLVSRACLALGGEMDFAVFKMLSDGSMDAKHTIAYSLAALAVTALGGLKNAEYRKLRNGQ